MPDAQVRFIIGKIWYVVCHHHRMALPVTIFRGSGQRCVSLPMRFRLTVFSSIDERIRMYPVLLPQMHACWRTLSSIHVWWYHIHEASEIRTPSSHRWEAGFRNCSRVHPPSSTAKPLGAGNSWHNFQKPLQVYSPSYLHIVSPESRPFYPSVCVRTVCSD